MKNLILILLAVLLVHTGLSQYGRYPKSQKPDKIFRQMEKQRKKDMKMKNKDRIRDLVLDLEDYTRDKVIPQLKDWKMKIDTALSVDDKIYLDSLRLIAENINEDAKILKKEKLKAAKSGNDDIINEDNKKMKEYKLQGKEINENLRSLISDYKKLFDPIKTECKQKTEAWEKEASDMVVKWTNSHGNLTDKEKKRLEGYWKYSNIINLNKIALWNGGRF